MRGAKTVSPASMAYWQSIGRGRRALQPRGWTSRASLIPTCCSAHRPRILVTRRTESRRRRQKRDRFTRSSAANVWRHAFPHASALVHRPARMIRCSLVSGRIAEPDGDGVIPCAARRASRSASRSAEGPAPASRHPTPARSARHSPHPDRLPHRVVRRHAIYNVHCHVAGRTLGQGFALVKKLPCQDSIACQAQSN